MSEVPVDLVILLGYFASQSQYVLSMEPARAMKARSTSLLFCKEGISWFNPLRTPIALKGERSSRVVPVCQW
jgi:hypothetical protein